jgi:hypothetical protein
MISDAVQEDQGRQGKQVLRAAAGVGSQAFTEMAAAVGLHVVKLLPTPPRNWASGY